MSTLPVPGDSWIGLGLEEQIGDGTSARVFAAFDPDLDRRVAVKVLDPDGIPAEWAERFVRDARIAGSLDHPRIIPTLRASTHDGIPYVVMPYIDQGDLRDELTRGPLSIDDTTNVVGRIGSALDRVHAAGLVHRNVRPAHILRTEHPDKVFLTGFGMVGRPMEHPHYASPQLIRGEAVTTATDHYSLGAILFECLTGRVPFPAETTAEVLEAHQVDEPPAVSALRPDLPAGLDDVIARALAKDLSSRYPSGQALVDAIMAARAGAGPARRRVLSAPTRPSAEASPSEVHADPPEAEADPSEPSVQPESPVSSESPVPSDPPTQADPTVAVPVAGVAPSTDAVPPATMPATPSPDATPDPDPTPDPDREPAPATSHPDPEPVPATPDPEPDARPTRPIRAVDAPARLADGSVDGERFGVYEDDDAPDRLRWIVVGVLVAASILVAVLTVRAINTDADLIVDPARTTTTETPQDPPVDPEG